MKLAVAVAQPAWSWRGELAEGRSFLGTGAHAEIVLPRAQFVSFAQRELELRVEGGRVLLRHLGMEPCTIDGAAVRQAALAAGRHVVVIGSVELVFEIT